MPKVSVIMSVYREPIEWIDASINSILEQTFKDFEFIIVDDNPESEELRQYLNIKARSDNRIVLITNHHNIGLTKSLNVALSKANGEYIARMDADDIASPNRFSKQVVYLENNSEKSIVHCNYSLIDEKNTIIKQKYHSFKNFSLSYSVWNNPIAHSTVMFKTSLSSVRTPLYNEDYKSAQDYELWAFLFLHTNVEIGYIDEVLLNYRISGNQVSRTRNSEQINNAKTSRRLCIIAFMKKLKLIDNIEGFDIKYLFKELSNVNRTTIPQEMEWAYMHLLFLFYYNLASKSVFYALRYVCDKNKLVRYFGIKQSLFVLAHPFIDRGKWFLYKL